MITSNMCKLIVDEVTAVNAELAAGKYKMNPYSGLGSLLRVEWTFSNKVSLIYFLEKIYIRKHRDNEYVLEINASDELLIRSEIETIFRATREQALDEAYMFQRSLVEECEPFDHDFMTMLYNLSNGVRKHVKSNYPR